MQLQLWTFSALLVEVKVERGVAMEMGHALLAELLVFKRTRDHSIP